MNAQAMTLHPRAVQLWRLQGLLRFAVFWVPVSTGLGVALGLALSPTPGVVVGLLLAGFQGLLALIWPAFEYDRFRYTLREADLLVQRGVLFRTWTSVPYARIQHVDTRQGPLERTLGLSRVLVFTASGVGADASVPGLDEAQAAELRDLLARRGGDDGV